MSNPNDPKEVVKAGYNSLSTTYRAHFAQSHDEHYMAWLNNFLAYIPPGTTIVELGCGDGIPIAQEVSKNYKYIGIDISSVQIELARQQVPEAIFQVADMTELSFPADSCSGIIALYSIIHVPLPQQPGLIHSMYQWLNANGYVLVTVGASAWTGTEKDWLLPGSAMYWSHADINTYIQWFSQAGFQIIFTQFVPEGTGGHTLLIAKKQQKF